MTNNKIPLTSQVRELFIVIRKDKEFPKKLIEEWCNENFDRYAFIEHKGDINEEGEVEGVHYHVYAHVRNKGVAKSTHLNTIQDKFKLENQDGICIEQVGNKVLCIQYLIHKNNKEKTQHQIDEIVTNIPSDELNNIMESKDGQEVSIDSLFRLCEESKRITEVMRAIGIDFYRLYRNVIWDIWSDVKLEQQKERVKYEVHK